MIGQILITWFDSKLMCGMNFDFYLIQFDKPTTEIEETSFCWSQNDFPFPIFIIVKVVFKATETTLKFSHSLLCSFS